MKAPKKKRKKPALKRVWPEEFPQLLILLLAAGVSAGLAVLNTFYAWDRDSGAFLWAAYQIARGLRPYFDFQMMYTPGLTLVHAIPSILGIPPIVSVYALPLLWALGGALSTYLVAFSFSKSRNMSWLLVSLYFLFSVDNGGGHVTLEHGVVFFTLMSFWLLRESKGPRWDFGAGVMAAMAVLSKQVGLVSLLPIGILLLAGAKRKAWVSRMRLFGGGFLVPFVLILAWLKFDIPTIYRNGYLAFTNYAYQESVLQIAVMENDLTRSPLTAVLLILSLAVGLVLAAGTKDKLLKVFYLAVTLSLVVYYIPRLYRDYHHYTLNCWPMIVVPLAAALSHRRRWRLAGALLASIGFLYLYHGDILRQRGYWNRWVRPGPVGGMFYPVAEKIKELLPKGTPILILGAEPIIEYLAEMAPEDMTLSTEKSFDAYEDKGYLTVLFMYDHWTVFKKRDQLIAAGYRLIPHAGAHKYLNVEIWKK